MQTFSFISNSCMLKALCFIAKALFFIAAAAVVYTLQKLQFFSFG
jgi:hypothetical protein